MFSKLASTLMRLSQALEQFFAILLKGLQNLTVFLGDAFGTLFVFLDVFGFIFLQFTLQLVKVLSVFLPGILLCLGFIWGHYWLGAMGLAYLLVLFTAVFGFKGIAKDSGSISEVPEGWLWFFPYSWSRDGFLREKLTPFLQIHAELNSISKSSRNTFLGKSLATVSNLSAQRLKLIRRGIHKLRGNESHFKSTVGNDGEKNSARSQFESGVDEYLGDFSTQYALVLSEIKSFKKKAESEMESKEQSEDGVDARIAREMAVIKSVFDVLEKIRL